METRPSSLATRPSPSWESRRLYHQRLAVVSAREHAAEPTNPQTGPGKSLVWTVTIDRMSIYRLYDTVGTNLGTFEDPDSNIAPGDVVVLEDGRDAHVTLRVEMSDGPVLVLFTAPGPPRIPTWRSAEFPAPRRFGGFQTASKVRV